MKQQDRLQNTTDQLVKLTSDFCDQKLDTEHKILARKLIYQLKKKNSLPMDFEKPGDVAAGVIHAIGSVNLLFDDTFEPYITERELYQYFDADPDTTMLFSDHIKRQLNLNVFDSKYSTHIENEDNPVKNMVSIDGIYISLDLLPSYLQKKVQEVRSKGYQIEFRSDEV